jgi:hypothetical protein
MDAYLLVRLSLLLQMGPVLSRAIAAEMLKALLAIVSATAAIFVPITRDRPKGRGICEAGIGIISSPPPRPGKV